MKNENCQDCIKYNNGWCKELKTNKDLNFLSVACKFKETIVKENIYIDTDSVTSIENKCTSLYAKLYQYGKIDFKSYEEQEQMIKILVEVCDLENDIILQLKKIINAKFGKIKGDLTNE